MFHFSCSFQVTEVARHPMYTIGFDPFLPKREVREITPAETAGTDPTNTRESEKRITGIGIGVTAEVTTPAVVEVIGTTTLPHPPNTPPEAARAK